MKKTFAQYRAALPDLQDKNGVREFIEGLVKDGMKVWQAKDYFVRLVQSRHPLHRYHCGAFSPVKPLNFTRRGK